MRTLIAVFLLSTTPVFAQTFPAYQSLTVNDYADVLTDTDEATLSRQLLGLKRDTGVEMTVLTLDSQSDYAPNMTFEAFATGLFNKWGIGDAQRNDGVLILVISGDRVIRIELGAAFQRDWDTVAQDVMNDHFLPSLREDKFAQGIKDGTTATIDKIVMPFLDGDEPAKNKQGPWIFGLFAAVIALSKGRGFLGDQFARFRTCPQCGQRGLRQSRRTVIPASTASSGSGVRQVHCMHCDFKEEHAYIVPHISKSSRGGFGGGRSGGGGASGRF